MAKSLPPVLKNIIDKIKNHHFSQREKNIFFSLITITILAIIVNILVLPIISKLEDIDKQIEQKTYLYQKYQGLIKQGENLSSLYDKYKAILGQERNAEEGTASLFEEIKKTAQNCNISIEKVKPLSIEKKNNYKQTSLELELTGDFASIFRFIYELEYCASLIKIKSMQLAGFPGAAGLLQCRVIFSKIFF